MNQAKGNGKGKENGKGRKERGMEEGNNYLKCLYKGSELIKKTPHIYIYM